jgi:hypothetical protein
MELSAERVVVVLGSKKVKSLILLVGRLFRSIPRFLPPDFESISVSVSQAQVDPCEQIALFFTAKCGWCLTCELNGCAINRFQNLSMTIAVSFKLDGYLQNTLE